MTDQSGSTARRFLRRSSELDSAGRLEQGKIQPGGGRRLEQRRVDGVGQQLQLALRLGQVKRAGQLDHAEIGPGWLKEQSSCLISAGCD